MPTEAKTNPQNKVVAVTSRKPDTGGVPATEHPRWYIAEVKYNYERVCREKAQIFGLEAYVASTKETHHYDGGKKRDVEHILIPCRVFIRMNDSQRVPFMKTCPYVYKFMTDKAGTADAYGHKPYAIVPDDQMQTLQFMLYNASNPVSFVEHPLHPGDRVRIVRGPLKDLEGAFVRDTSGTHIAVAIDNLGYAVTSIAIDDVQPA